MLKNPHIIGAWDKISFPKDDIFDVPARVDTGAKTSSIWATNISEKNGILTFYLFDKRSKYYSGKPIKSSSYSMKRIKSTNGLSERRYVVKFSATINDRRIKASFTLANRQKQKYPILIGRNILRGKFIVDIKHNLKSRLHLKD